MRTIKITKETETNYWTVAHDSNHTDIDKAYIDIDDDKWEEWENIEIKYYDFQEELKRIFKEQVNVNRI